MTCMHGFCHVYLALTFSFERSDLSPKDIIKGTSVFLLTCTFRMMNFKFVKERKETTCDVIITRY